MYVEYVDGFRELYDLRADPYQLNNVFNSADKGHVKNQSERLAELLVFGGESSRETTGSQVRLNPFFAPVREPGQTVLDFSSEQAGHSVWDDESLALAIVDAV